MKVKKDLIIMEEEGNIVGVPTGRLIKKIKSTIFLTESGKFIVETLQKEDLTTEQIAERLGQRYNIDMNTAVTDTEKFVQKLEDYHLIKHGFFK